MTLGSWLELFESSPSSNRRHLMCDDFAEVETAKHRQEIWVVQLLLY